MRTRRGFGSPGRFLVLEVAAAPTAPAGEAPKPAPAAIREDEDSQDFMRQAYARLSRGEISVPAGQMWDLAGLRGPHGIPGATIPGWKI